MWNREETVRTAKMSAMASPFRVPEDPHAATELDKDTPNIEGPPGINPSHYTLSLYGYIHQTYLQLIGHNIRY